MLAFQGCDPKEGIWLGVTGNQLDTCGLTVSGQREPEGGTAQAYIGDGN